MVGAAAAPGCAQARATMELSSSVSPPTTGRNMSLTHDESGERERQQSEESMPWRSSKQRSRRSSRRASGYRCYRPIRHCLATSLALLGTMAASTMPGIVPTVDANRVEVDPNDLSEDFQGTYDTIVYNDDDISSDVTYKNIKVAGIPITGPYPDEETSPQWVSPSPTSVPTLPPTDEPTARPSSSEPTDEPTTLAPTHEPTTLPPTPRPTNQPTLPPSLVPTTMVPTNPLPTTPAPTDSPTDLPTLTPTQLPTASPTTASSNEPSSEPTADPSHGPTDQPTPVPTASFRPSTAPTVPQPYTYSIEMTSYEVALTSVDATLGPNELQVFNLFSDKAIESTWLTRKLAAIGEQDEAAYGAAKQIGIAFQTEVLSQEVLEPAEPDAEDRTEDEEEGDVAIKDEEEDGNGVVGVPITTNTPSPPPVANEVVPTPSPVTADETTTDVTASEPTAAPSTPEPTPSPTTLEPTPVPSTLEPTQSPTTLEPTPEPSTSEPTIEPTALSLTAKSEKVKKDKKGGRKNRRLQQQESSNPYTLLVRQKKTAFVTIPGQHMINSIPHALPTANEMEAAVQVAYGDEGTSSELVKELRDYDDITFGDLTRIEFSQFVYYNDDPPQTDQDNNVVGGGGPAGLAKAEGSSNAQPSDKMSGGAVFGIVFAAAFGCAMLGMLVLYVRKRRQGRSVKHAASTEKIKRICGSYKDKMKDRIKTLKPKEKSEEGSQGVNELEEDNFLEDQYDEAIFQYEMDSYVSSLGIGGISGEDFDMESNFGEGSQGKRKVRFEDDIGQKNQYAAQMRAELQTKPSQEGSAAGGASAGTGSTPGTNLDGVVYLCEKEEVKSKGSGQGIEGIFSND